MLNNFAQMLVMKYLHCFLKQALSSHLYIMQCGGEGIRGSEEGT